MQYYITVDEIRTFPNYQFAAERMVRDFYNGHLGRVNLDYELMFPQHDLPVTPD